MLVPLELRQCGTHWVQLPRFWEESHYAFFLFICFSGRLQCGGFREVHRYFYQSVFVLVIQLSFVWLVLLRDIKLTQRFFAEALIYVHSWAAGCPWNPPKTVCKMLYCVTLFSEEWAHIFSDPQMVHAPQNVRNPWHCDIGSHHFTT